jgi:uridine kinase
MEDPSRERLLHILIAAIVAAGDGRLARVAIDGVDGAGKTILADELAPHIEARGRTVIRASADGFHHPRELRYRRGEDSAEGFYYDSFDYRQLRSTLIDPLAPGGNRRYRTAVFDSTTNEEVVVPTRVAPPDAVLLFDGIFAQRPELHGVWDLVVFLQVAFEETLRRSQLRDARPGQSRTELERRFWKRYAGGQGLYLKAVQPHLRADIVVDNHDPARPTIVRREGPLRRR